MKVTLVEIPVEEIVDWDSFHTVFRVALGFPEFYGRNLDAWIDCLVSADDPAGGMVTVAVEPGGLLVLVIDGVEDFRSRCPEQYEALVDCAATVDQSRRSVGQPPVLALSFA